MGAARLLAAVQIVATGVLGFAPPPSCGPATGLASPVCSLGLQVQRSVRRSVSSREHIQTALSMAGDGEFAAIPQLVVFDLDNTLWTPELYQVRLPVYARARPHTRYIRASHLRASCRPPRALVASDARILMHELRTS
jgi:hypothetical protein